VVNGYSDLLLEVWGDAGKSARAAVGVAALPFNVTVEVSAVFQLRL
jgi:enamine deaminase RidA (YjgF/YER057c/UK114 family)